MTGHAIVVADLYETGRLVEGEVWADIQSSDNNYSTHHLAPFTSNLGYETENLTAPPQNWSQLSRVLAKFSGLDTYAGKTLSNIKVSVWVANKYDFLSATPDWDAFEITPDAWPPTTATFGSPFANPKSYADTTTGGSNLTEFDPFAESLSDLMAAIAGSGIFYLGFKDYNYDYLGDEPNWVQSQYSSINITEARIEFDYTEGPPPPPPSTYTFVERDAHGQLPPGCQDLEIQTVLGQTISTLRGTIHDKANNITIKEGTDIVEYDIGTGEKLFAGLISYATDYTTGREVYHDLLCQSYSILLDRSIVYAAYPAGFTAGGYSGDKAILYDLFTSKVIGQNGVPGASEINVGTYVDTGTTGLTALNFFYMTLRECLNLLASYVGFSYYVDYDKELHYYYQPNATAPYGLSTLADRATTIAFHNFKRKKDATSLLNNYTVIGTQLQGADRTSLFGGNGTAATWYYIFLGTTYIPVGSPSGYQKLRIFNNTGTDISPVWTEIPQANIGIAPVDAPVPPDWGSAPASAFDVLYDPGNNVFYWKVAPADLTYSVQIIYCLIIGAGIPDFEAGSISKYGRIFSTRLIASDANSAATIFTNLAHIKKQYAYALEQVYCSVDTVDFPSTTRFEIGQLVHLYHELLGIDKDFSIHAITAKVQGGMVYSYDLELRSWSTE